MEANNNSASNFTSSLRRDDFAEDFIFGSASSAYQMEGAAAGGRGPSTWDTFTEQTADKEYVKIIKKIGLDAYRFKTKRRPGVNKAGIEHYNNQYQRAFG
ncbi:hypothetical protein ACH5RR_003358 [Cinchona calisaya]|uniref:Beta-glucosidase n=1 Tax=Cinchona calisaya TaxID=153742 RepID=A0ABD3AVA7_9GENT